VGLFLLLVWVALGVRSGRRARTAVAIVLMAALAVGYLVAVLLGGQAHLRPGSVLFSVGMPVTGLVALLRPAARRYVRAGGDRVVEVELPVRAGDGAG